MLRDNSRPHYLPHLDSAAVLQMGLAPLGESPWIETDTHLGDYYRHKLQQREQYGTRVFRTTRESLPAQLELAAALRAHLCGEQGELYRVEGGELVCPFAGIRTPLQSDEPLWTCSLWVADDLVIMQEASDGYRLTAASLCCASHWRLEEKFDRPLRRIHDPIPGFHRVLSPRVDRVFNHLRPEHPVVRYNWAVQAGDSLNARTEQVEPVRPDTPLYYRTERQSLVRLPRTGAIAFTIRVYLHPLATLTEIGGALPALIGAIDLMPPALRAYKGFDRLEPALARYRERYR